MTSDYYRAQILEKTAELSNLVTSGTLTPEDAETYINELSSIYIAMENRLIQEALADDRING